MIVPSKSLCSQSSILQLYSCRFFFSISMSLHCSKEGLKEEHHRSFLMKRTFVLSCIASYRVRARGFRSVGADGDRYGLPDNGKGF